jgi:signal transduction histidine kinase
VFRIRGDTGLDEAMRALFLGLEPLRIPWLDPLGRLWRVSIQPVTAPEPGDERAVLGFVASFVDRTDTVRLDDLRESVVEFSSARVRDALTVIIGYAGLARERLEDSSTRVMMDTVHERAVQVSRALEDLKAVGQLAATDHLSITVDARRLITEVLGEVTTIADERDVALRSFVPEIGLPVRVVPDDARDALSALLREATATAPPGSEVVLRLDQDHQGSVIRVEWSGPGIDPLVREYCVGAWHQHPERLPEVLRPFARVRRSFPYLDLDGAPGGGVAVSLAMHHAVEGRT